MGRPTGVGVLVKAVVQQLRADAALTALVPATSVVSDAEGEDRPYLLVEHVNETDDDTLALGGVDAIVSVTVVSDYAGPKPIGAIASAVRTSLDGAELTVDGFTAPADVSYEQAIPEYQDDIANVKVRHRPLWFRIRAL